MADDRSDAIPPEVRAKLKTPLVKIIKELGSKSKHTAGLALETLAVRMSYDLGLIPLRFRERGADTGGAEVDLVTEGAQLHFSRWLFQCKNVKGSVPLSALAKEIGMAVLLKAHVIVLATTGTFASTVEDHAKSLAETTPLQVVLIDRTVVDNYVKRGALALWGHLDATAKDTMRLKRPQVTNTEAASTAAVLPVGTPTPAVPPSSEV